jgi:hypothetical protein
LLVRRVAVALQKALDDEAHVGPLVLAVG